MAKKKSKKQTNLVINLVIIALSVLIVCTLFMPVYTHKLDNMFTGSSSSSTTGSDVIAATFASEYSSDLSTGTNSLVALKNSEENGFVATVSCWAYFLTIVAAAALAVFALLGLLGIKFDVFTLICGAATLLLGIIAAIFIMITAGKFGSVDLGSLVSAKTVAAIGAYILFAGLIAGGAAVYSAKK